MGEHIAGKGLLRAVFVTFEFATMFDSLRDAALRVTRAVSHLVRVVL